MLISHRMLTGYRELRRKGKEEQLCNM